MKKKAILNTDFIVAILVLVSMTVSFWLGRLSEKEFVNGLTFSYFIYSGGRIWQDKIRKKEDNKVDIPD